MTTIDYKHILQYNYLIPGAQTSTKTNLLYVLWKFRFYATKENTNFLDQELSFLGGRVFQVDHESSTYKCVINHLFIINLFWF